MEEGHIIVILKVFMSFVGDLRLPGFSPIPVGGRIPIKFADPLKSSLFRRK